jgi:acetate---CoA ligase (ADP-forming)
VLEAVAKCAGRAVFKVVAPGLTHKSDVGGVLLGVDETTASDAYRRLMSLQGATGVLVEEQIESGVEALVGIAPSGLGPLLTVGVGGVLTEVVDDVSVRLLPVTVDDVREMIASTRLGRMLAGVRGAVACDVDAFVDLVVRVASAAGGWSGELDLNPVVVTPAGAVVLDAAFIETDPASYNEGA